MNRQTFNYERSRAKYLIQRGQNVEYWSGYVAGLDRINGGAVDDATSHSTEWIAGHADALCLADKPRGRPTSETTKILSIRLPKRVFVEIDKQKRKIIKDRIISDHNEYSTCGTCIRFEAECHFGQKEKKACNKYYPGGDDETAS